MSPTTAPAEPRLRMPKGERREQLIAIAGDIVRERGVHAVTMERVAAVAGVTKPIVYAHFANTVALLAALIEREERAVDAEVMARLSGATTFRDVLRACSAPWFDAFTHPRSVYRGLVLEQAARAELREEQIARSGRVIEFIAGLLRTRGGVPQRDAMVAAAVLIGGFEKAAAYWANTPNVDVARVQRTYEAMTEAAVAALAAGVTR